MRSKVYVNCACQTLPSTILQEQYAIPTEAYIVKQNILDIVKYIKYKLSYSNASDIVLYAGALRRPDSVRLVQVLANTFNDRLITVIATPCEVVEHLEELEKIYITSGNLHVIVDIQTTSTESHNTFFGGEAYLFVALTAIQSSVLDYTLKLTLSKLSDFSEDIGKLTLPKKQNLIVEFPNLSTSYNAQLPKDTVYILENMPEVLPKVFSAVTGFNGDTWLLGMPRCVPNSLGITSEIPNNLHFGHWIMPTEFSSTIQPNGIIQFFNVLLDRLTAFCQCSECNIEYCSGFYPYMIPNDYEPDLIREEL